MNGPVHSVRNHPFAQIKPMDAPADRRDQDVVDTYNTELGFVQSAHLHLIDPKGMPKYFGWMPDDVAVSVDDQGRKHVIKPTVDGHIEWTLSAEGNLEKEVLKDSGMHECQTIDKWTRSSGSFEWKHTVGDYSSPSSTQLRLTLEGGKWSNWEHVRYSPDPVPVAKSGRPQDRKEYNEWLAKITSTRQGDEHLGIVHSRCYMAYPGKIYQLEVDDGYHGFVDTFRLDIDGSISRTRFVLGCYNRHEVVEYLRDGDALVRHDFVTEEHGDKQQVLQDTRTPV